MGQFLFLAVWISGGVFLLIWLLYERAKAKKKGEEDAG